MGITAEIFATVSPLPPAEYRPGILSRVTTAELGPLSTTVDPSGDLAEALAPSTSTQIVHTEAFAQGPIGGINLTADDVVAWSWEEDQAGLAWRLEVAAQVVDELGAWISGPVLTEQAFGGAPPPGIGAVDIVAGIETHLGATTDFIVVGNGLATSSSRPVIGAERVLQLSGVGAWGRTDRVLVSLNLPPGHGLNHGELVGEILSRIGLLSAQLPGPFGEPLVNPVELHCVAGWPEAVRAADGAGRWLRWSQAEVPRVEAVPLVPSPTSTPVRTFTAADFLLGETGALETDGDVPTHYIVTGSVSELPDGGDGAVTTEAIVETWDDFFVIPQAYFAQAGSEKPSSGSLVALSVDTTPRRALVSRITTRTTSAQGCDVIKEVITEGWYAPESARYRQLATSGVPDPQGYVSTYVYDPDAVKDDETTSFEWPAFRFIETSRVVHQSYYGSIPSTSGLTPAQRILIGKDTGGSLLTAKRPGDLMLEVVKTSLWYNLREAVFEDGDYALNDVKLTASGVGVFYGAEAYFVGPSDPPYAPTDVQVFRDTRQRVHDYYSVDRKVFAGDDDGYLTDTDQSVLKFARDKKKPYVFDDEGAASEVMERGVRDTTVTESFAATSARSHTSITAELDVTERLVENGREVRFENTYLPRRGYCDPDDARSASNRTVSGEHFCGTGTFLGQAPEIIDHPYIESDQAALERAETECLQDHAPTLQGTILIDPRLRVGHPVVIDLPDAELGQRRAWIYKLDGSKDARSARSGPGLVLMRVVFKLDPRG